MYTFILIWAPVPPPGSGVFSNWKNKKNIIFIVARTWGGLKTKPAGTKNSFVPRGRRSRPQAQYPQLGPEGPIGGFEGSHLNIL